jgi:hypothetical protein
LGLPAIRFAAKRLTLLSRLKRLGRKQSFRVHLRNHTALFSGLRGVERDLLVETADCIYAIKLCGSLHPANSLWFVDSERYAIRKLRFAFAPGAGRDIPYEERPLPAYRFTAPLPKGVSPKPMIPILLCNPLPRQLLCGKARTLATDGVQIGEFRLYSAAGFLKLLEQPQTI